MTEEVKDDQPEYSKALGVQYEGNQGKKGSNKEKTLVDWKNKPSLQALRQNLEDALPAYDLQMRKVSQWLDYFNVVGAARPAKEEGRSGIQPRLIRKQYEWRVPALTEPFLSTPDLFKLSPVTYEDAKSARQNGLLINNQFNNKLRKVAIVERFVSKATREGTAITRTGWTKEVVKEETVVPTFTIQAVSDEKMQAEFEQLMQFAQSDPIRFKQDSPDEVQQAVQLSVEKGIPLLAVETGAKTVLKERTVKNQPTVDNVPIEDVIPDPTCEGDIDNCQFIIYKFRTSLSALKKETGRYHNLDLVQSREGDVLSELANDSLANLSDSEFSTVVRKGQLEREGYRSTATGATEHKSNHTQTGSFTFKDKPRAKLLAYEYWGYWDIDNSGITTPIVVTWVDDVIIRMEINPLPDGKPPFEFTPYIPVIGSLYGEPDGALLQENQNISGAIIRGVLDSLGRSANGQKGMRKDMLDWVNRERFYKGKDYLFNASVDPRTGFVEHKYPETPRSAIEMINIQNQEAESLTGVQSFSQGVASQSLGKVAIGIRSALDAASKRELAILRRLAEGMTNVGRRIVAMNQVFLEEEEVVRVTQEEFVTIRRDDLDGRVDLSIDIATAESDDQKAQELAFMLQTTAQSSDPEEVRLIRADIARLRKMPELAKKIENFQPTPDPLAEEKAKLEVELLKAQIENELAKSRENNANGLLDEAKAETERANAALALAQRDKIDLEYLEQEKGVTHARDIEKAELSHGFASELKDKDLNAKIAQEQIKIKNKPKENLKQ